MIQVEEGEPGQILFLPLLGHSFLRGICSTNAHGSSGRDEIVFQVQFIWLKFGLLVRSSGGDDPYETRHEDSANRARKASTVELKLIIQAC